MGNQELRHVSCNILFLKVTKMPKIFFGNYLCLDGGIIQMVEMTGEKPITIQGNIQLCKRTCKWNTPKTALH